MNPPLPSPEELRSQMAALSDAVASLAAQIAGLRADLVAKGVIARRPARALD